MKKIIFLTLVLALVMLLFTACKSKVEYLSTDPNVQIGASKTDKTENENNVTSQNDVSSKKQNSSSKKQNSSKITQSQVVSDWGNVEGDNGGDSSTSSKSSSTKKPSSSSSSKVEESSSSQLTVSQDSDTGWSPVVPIG